jgi:HEPN domain-containing protein
MQRAADLLDDAQDSLGAAQDLLISRRWAKVCLLAQQAAELAVKAAFNTYGKERRGHTVHRLLAELGQESPDALALVEERYMNAFAEGSARSHFTEKQAREAVVIAEKILARMTEVVREQTGAGR